MAKKINDYEMQEFFIKKTQKIVVEKSDVQQEAVAADTADEAVACGPTVFEESLLKYSSANVPKRKRRRKKKVGTDAVVRLMALLLCFGVLAFSVISIIQRSRELDAAKKAHESSSLATRKAEGDQSMKRTKRPDELMDLLSYLGSSLGGLEMFEALDTDTQVYYETLREIVFDKKKINPDCWGYVVMSHSQIAEPIMKGKDNYEYLYRLDDRTANRSGSVFADSYLKDDYEKNRNVVLYGHCMTDGTRFRGIKLFFDDENRYSMAQDLEITVVTEDAVYVYEYFSGYRAEGDRFATCYSTNTSSASFYQFLTERRRLNTISKDVSYDENSKIITLITCTNLSSKPSERYVLHGILKNTYYF